MRTKASDYKNNKRLEKLSVFQHTMIKPLKSIAEFEIEFDWIDIVNLGGARVREMEPVQ